MATHVHEGNRIDYTPGSAVTAGDVVVLGGSLVGVADQDIAANRLGALAVEGVYDFPKVAATAMNAGDDAYWDVADTEINTDSGNPKAGVVVADAAAADTTVRVKLTP